MSMSITNLKSVGGNLIDADWEVDDILLLMIVVMVLCSLNLSNKKN
jgi:hypothetical protein